jgi:cytochrome c heme-lyase
MAYDEEHDGCEVAASEVCTNFDPDITFSSMGQTTSTPANIPQQPSAAREALGAARCPVDHSAMSKKTESPAQCPVQDDVNPRNQMPDLQQHPISQNQTASLSTERLASSIPRDKQATWDYPSPQQFYNALVRKGWETPEEHIDTMVDIHNFLNEQAWNEVLKWEKRVDGSGFFTLCKNKADCYF